MKPKEQRMREIEGHYPDQWVLIQVTRSDRYGRTTHGIVLGHGGDSEKAALVQEARQFRQENPEVQTFIFWTGRLIPEGVGVVL